jgi:hypothetical protein
VSEVWPIPTSQGMRTRDSYAPWITYHYPYTDDEAAALGVAVIDATCHTCHQIERITIPMAVNPDDDEVPESGISVQRSEFTMRHLHGRRTTA